MNAVDQPPRFRVEHRRPHLPPVVLVETERLIEAARALEDHRHRLACAGVRGTLVIVCRLATTEMLVVERVIDLGAALS